MKATNTTKKDSNNIRCYSELCKLQTYAERFAYLKLTGHVGEDTFGRERQLNQFFYRSREWRSLRDQIIIRDNGCDMGVEGQEIYGRIIIHHMNPITLKDIATENMDALMNPEYLICVSHSTHNAIHYGSADLLADDYTPRRPNDTCPWKQQTH